MINKVLKSRELADGGKLVYNKVSCSDGADFVRDMLVELGEVELMNLAKLVVVIGSRACLSKSALFQHIHVLTIYSVVKQTDLHCTWSSANRNAVNPSNLGPAVVQFSPIKCHRKSVTSFINRAITLWAVKRL